MKVDLLLHCDSETIGVIRNPYERVVNLYMQSLDYVGLDNWLAKCPPEKQVVLYKDCDHLVRFEAWENELKFYDLHPKDTSILKDEEIVPMWNRWYTMKTKTLVYSLYREDITTYGYSF